MAAAVFMILTGAGAVAGIPALIGLVSSRNTSAGRAQGAQLK